MIFHSSSISKWRVLRRRGAHHEDRSSSHLSIARLMWRIRKWMCSKWRAWLISRALSPKISMYSNINLLKNRLLNRQGLPKDLILSWLGIVSTTIMMRITQSTQRKTWYSQYSNRGRISLYRVHPRNRLTTHLAKKLMVLLMSKASWVSILLFTRQAEWWGACN